jgi:hypothetical protein
MPVHADGPPELEVGQAMTAPAKGTESAAPEAFPMEEFLDRLMAAESGGRLNKKNPRSTALGPFQFIESTFISVVNKHFPTEVAGRTERQVLALRTNMAFARRAAGAYANDLISALKDEGLPATAVNVRLAFLIGPSAAVRLLRAPPDQPLRNVLSADAIAANPFMSVATVAKLVQKAAADVSAMSGSAQLGPLNGEPAATVGPFEREPAGASVAVKAEPDITLVALEGEPPADAADSRREPARTPAASNSEPIAAAPAGPPFEVKCEIGLPSCRRWIALQERKAQLARSR